MSIKKLSSNYSKINRGKRLISFFVIVDDIPEITKDGPRALPSPNGDSVLHIYESNIYELQCKPSSCSWRKWPRRFTSRFKRKRWFHAMYISEDITDCNSEYYYLFKNTIFELSIHITTDNQLITIISTLSRLQ